MAYEFEFGFTSREQFYGIVKLLNQECGKRNWTIRGKVLRGLKRNERFQSYHTHWFNPPIKKMVVVPSEMMYVEAMIRFIHTDEKATG